MAKQNFTLSDAKQVAATGVLTEKPKVQPQPPRYTEGYGSVSMDTKWMEVDDTKFHQKNDLGDFLGLSPSERKWFGLGGRKVVCNSCNISAESKKFHYCRTCGAHYKDAPEKGNCTLCGSKVNAGAIYTCNNCKALSKPGYEKLADGKQVRVADVMGRNEAFDEFFNDELTGYKAIYVNAAFAVLSFVAMIFTFVVVSPWVAAVFALLCGKYFELWLIANHFSIAYNKSRTLISTV